MMMMRVMMIIGVECDTFQYVPPLNSQIPGSSIIIIITAAICEGYVYIQYIHTYIIIIVVYR